MSKIERDKSDVNECKKDLYNEFVKCVLEKTLEKCKLDYSRCKLDCKKPEPSSVEFCKISIFDLQKYL